MNNKLIKIALIIVMMFCLNVNVLAATGADKNQPNYSTLKAKYDEGVNKTTISSSETYTSANVTIYGKSDCTGNSCTHTYAASNSSSFKDALAKSVVCSTGEKNITYMLAGSGKDAFDSSKNSSLNYTGDAYWSEDYQVSCTSNSSGSSVINLNNDSSTTTTNSSNSGTTNGSEYNSSSTVNQEQTGVTTYFIVLGLVALISSIFMMCVKKYNLFKNI